MTIAEKLLKIQTALKAPKSQYNSFGKYYYRSCEDILEAAKPICQQHGAVLTVNDEIVQIGERIYVKATATLTDIETGEKEYATAYAREDDSKKGMDASQVTGSTSSYSRKYALNGLFCIDDSKIEGSPDPDTGRNENTAELLAELQSLAKQKGVLPNKITARYKVNSLSDLNIEQIKNAIGGLNKMSDAG